MTNRSHRLCILGSVLSVAAFSLLAAGCGGGGSSGVANVASHTTATTTTTTSGLLVFSQCMRSHGVPNFPDPQRFAGGNVKLTIHQLQPSQASLDACSPLLPRNGGSGQTSHQSRRQLADELSFARCMRSHGVSRFPDPTAQGGLSVEMVQAQGIDVHSRAVLRVVYACLPASHGALTPAMIRHSLNDARG
jgi:hypothetical protein